MAAYRMRTVVRTELVRVQTRGRKSSHLLLYKYLECGHRVAIYSTLRRRCLPGISRAKCYACAREERHGAPPA